MRFCFALLLAILPLACVRRLGRRQTEAADQGPARHGRLLPRLRPAEADSRPRHFRAATVEWTVVQQGGTTTNSKIPLYEDKDWAKGFDVVVHNECFSDVKDKEWVETILKPHREGVGGGADSLCDALLPHRRRPVVRVRRRAVAGPRRALRPQDRDHRQGSRDHAGPLRVGRPSRASSITSSNSSPTRDALATATRQDTGEPQTCVWTNKYGKGNVFATTIGHHNETMADPAYLDMVTRGLLWSVGRIDEFKKTDEATDKEILKLIDIPVEEPKQGGVAAAAEVLRRRKSCSRASRRRRRAKKRPRATSPRRRSMAICKTRWCANGGSAGEWWQVDLGEPQHLRSLRIHWEMDGGAYRYKVEASPNGSDWKTIVDQSKNDKKERIISHEIDSPDTKFLKVTFLGNTDGKWGCFWEIEAYAGDLPKLPEGVSATGGRDGDGERRAGVLAKDEGEDKQPATFDVTLFGVPPEVNYPVCLAARRPAKCSSASTSRARSAKRRASGKVLRCVDTDGDGQADKINVVRQDGPPARADLRRRHALGPAPAVLDASITTTTATASADRQETLVTGLTTDEVEQARRRPHDQRHPHGHRRLDLHRRRRLRLHARRRARTAPRSPRRGGGIVRVRPDGTELEVYSLRPAQHLRRRRSTRTSTCSRATTPTTAAAGTSASAT